MWKKYFEFSSLKGSPTNESVKQGTFMTKIFFKLLNEFLKSCKNDIC